jgi:hypothetical protein
MEKIPGILKKTALMLIEIIKMAFVLGICGGIGIFFAVGERAGSSERFAEQYFSYYITNNYQEMYKMVDTTESSFISYDNFANMCSSEKVYGQIQDYKMGSATKHGADVTYVVSYYMYEDPQPYTYTITLKRQIENVYGFFPTWKVSVRRFLVSNFEIFTPAGMEASLDGKSLERYKKGQSEDGTKDIYKVSSIFIGDHTLAISDPMVGKMSRSVFVEKGDKSLELTTKDFKLDNGEFSNMRDLGSLLLTEMYAKAMDGVSTFENNLAPYFASDAQSQANGKQIFDSIKTQINQEDGTSLRSLNIEKADGTLLSYEYPDKVVLKLDYTYSFEVARGASLVSGIVSYYSGRGASTAIYTFRLVDGAWKLTELVMPCVSFERI